MTVMLHPIGSSVWGSRLWRMSDSSPHYDPELQAFLENNPDIDRSSLAPEGIALRQQFVSLGLEGLVTGRNLEQLNQTLELAMVMSFL